MKKLIILISAFYFAMRVPIFAANFTELAQNATQGIEQQIIKHPFLQQLANGTLAKNKFNYYNNQDQKYDWQYSDALLTLAIKAPDAKMRAFLVRAANSSVAHWQGAPPSTMEQCPYCQAYSNFERSSVDESFSQGLAAIAPCYFVYWTVAQWLKVHSVPGNPYQDWINGYVDPNFVQHVQELGNFLDEVACSLAKQEQDSMLAKYVRSAQFEWHFWNSAYQEAVWEPR